MERQGMIWCKHQQKGTDLPSYFHELSKYLWELFPTSNFFLESQWYPQPAGLIETIRKLKMQRWSDEPELSFLMMVIIISMKKYRYMKWILE